MKHTPNEKLTVNNTVFFSTCNNAYITKSATSLLSIRRFLPDAHLYILSRNISLDNQILLKQLGIEFADMDLRSDFYRHWDYPVECYYIFAGPEFFHNLGYHFSVYLDGDVLCLDNPLKISTYISGIAGIAVGKSRNVFGNDVDTLLKLFNLAPEKMEQLRINSGVVYFNNRQMDKVGLLKNVASIFHKCIDYRTPRKGDDSLFALFQLIFMDQSDILPLDAKYNFIPTVYGYTIPKTLVFIHLNEKPWLDGWMEGEKKSLAKFVNSWRDIYLSTGANKTWEKKKENNTNTEAQRINTLSKDGLAYSRLRRCINRFKKPIDVFISEDSVTGIFNFGDELPKILIPKLFGYRVKSTDMYNCKLLSIGSILEYASDINPKRRVICWGSGFISEKKEFNTNILKKIKFVALRGERTLKRIQKIKPLNKKIPLGDPGILASVLFSKSKNTNKIGVVAHYVDVSNPIVRKLRLDKRFIVIDPMDSPDVVAEQISGCKLILSSSLHGMIFADSYSIPNARVCFSNLVYGGDYKFRDYCSGVGQKYCIADIDKIFDDNYLNTLINQYRPVKDLKKIQRSIIRAFPFR